MLNEKAMLAAVDTYTDEEFIDTIIRWLAMMRNPDLNAVSEGCAFGEVLANIHLVEDALKAYRKKKFGSKGITTI